MWQEIGTFLTPQALQIQLGARAGKAIDCQRQDARCSAIVVCLCQTQKQADRPLVSPVARVGACPWSWPGLRHPWEQQDLPIVHKRLCRLALLGQGLLSVT